MKDIINIAMKKADEADIFRMRTKRTLVSFESGRLKEIDTIENVGMAMRVIRKGRIGQVIFTNNEVAPEMIDKAVAIAELGDKATFKFPKPGKCAKLALSHPDTEKFDAEKMLPIGQKAIDMLREYEPNILSGCSLAKTFTEVTVANSNGVCESYERGEASFGIGGELIEGKDILQIGKVYRGIAPCTDHEAVTRECIDDFRVGRIPSGIPTGKHPVIFAPAALGDVLMAFEGSVNGDAVARKLSPLTNKKGQKILDERITITNDSLRPDGILSQPIDDEGVPSQSTSIIRNGVLENFITDLRSATETKLPLTGNGSRMKPFEFVKYYGAGVAPSFTNMVFSGGKMPYEEMIRATKCGVEVHHITGILLGNLINGDFAGNCEVAFKIENGKRVGRVKDTMISGNFFQLFKDNIIDLSREQIWSGSFGGTAGSFLIPYAYLKDVNLAAR